MVYNVINSFIARKTFQQNLEYLEEEWTLLEIQNFLKKTDEVVKILKKAPYTFQEWEHNSSIRKIQVVKQITIFYRVTKTTVEIILFWNNYKNPNNLFKLL